MGADDKYPTIEIDPPDPLDEAINYWRDHWLAPIPSEGFSECDPHERAILAAARSWHTLTEGDGIERLRVWLLGNFDSAYDRTDDPYEASLFDARAVVDALTDTADDAST